MSNPKIFTAAELSARMEKVASVNRYDQVSRLMNDIFANKASKNPDALVSSLEVTSTFSKIANLNKQSDFRFYFEDIFEGNTPTEKRASETVGATSRLAGYDEDFRPSPVEVVVTDAEKIKKASLKVIASVLNGLVDNPQYHFNEFVEVEGYGKNSGYASWKVAFQTGKGTAEIGIPIPVIDGVVETPSVFYASARAISFDKDSIRKFAQSYAQNIRQATGTSGVETLGGTSIITERQNLGESPIAHIDINFGLGTIINEDAGAVTATVYDKKKMIAAIETARKFVESKVGAGINLKYSAGMETEDKKYIVAFNVFRNTAEGLKVATIPVEVDGIRASAETFVDSSSQNHPLDSQALNSYLSTPAAEFSMPETDSFTDSFLTTSGSFKQLKDELKLAAFTGKSERAKSVLYAIANRFGEENLANAMDDFKTWTVEASEVKSGKKAKPKDIIEREATFDGVMKSSSIVIN